MGKDATCHSWKRLEIYNVYRARGWVWKWSSRTIFPWSWDFVIVKFLHVRRSKCPTCVRIWATWQLIYEFDVLSQDNSLQWSRYALALFKFSQKAYITCRGYFLFASLSVTNSFAGCLLAGVRFVFGVMKQLTSFRLQETVCNYDLKVLYFSMLSVTDFLKWKLSKFFLKAGSSSSAVTNRK